MVRSVGCQRLGAVSRTLAVTSAGVRRWQGMVTMPDDPEITDEALGSEIELLGEVITAAAGAEGLLTDAQVDAVLGVDLDGVGPGPAPLDDAVP